MMKTKRSYWILALLNLLLLGSVQRGVAEDGQPRMYIPDAEVDDASIIGYSIITPKNPYFTFYLWYLNTDHKNAYWTESPVLTVDGHSLTLSGIHGDNPFDKNNPSAFNTLTCKDGNGNILYWVHWREYFKVGDRSFTESFALKQFNGNPNEDWYVVMEIMFPENVDGGDPHTVSVRGKAHLDSHDDGYYDALGPNNEKVLKNGGTQAPFGVFENVGTSLDWTNPGELTFTSQSFENKTNWGQYFVTMDGQTSVHKRSGGITVTKDYGEQVDFGVYNMGGVRADLPKGAITYGDVLDIAPFENKIAFTTLTGSDLMELFKEMADAGGEGISHAVRLVIHWDASQKVFTLVSATINGEPVDPQREYRIVTIDYLLGGTDKLSAFKKGHNINSPQDVSNNSRFVIMNYFREMDRQGKVVDAEIEGRVVIDNKDELNK